MKEKHFNYLIIFLCIFVLLELFIQRDLVHDSVMQALLLWFKSLIPSLFPFFIISNILIKYNISAYFPIFFKNFIKRIFHINDYMVMIWVIGLISGNPTCTQNIRLLYDDGKISDNEANHILLYSHFINPQFIISIVCGLFFNNKQLSLVILLSHYLSNIIIGIIFRDKLIKMDVSFNDTSKNISFGKVFLASIKNALDSILLICGILTIFLILANIIVEILNLNIFGKMIVKGIIEITMGLENLGKFNISEIYKVVLASGFLAFGGLSIHMQVYSFIVGTKIKYSYFFKGRVIQSILAMIISSILYFIRAF